MSGSKNVPPPRPVVSNSGPLIALATIGKLALLEALFEEVAIPQAVFDEVAVQGQGEPGSREIAEASWTYTAQIRDQLAVNLLQESLDAGESEAIVLIGLRVTGTLGILLMAKEASLISAIQPTLDDLRRAGFWTSDAVYQEVLIKDTEA